MAIYPVRKASLPGSSAFIVLLIILDSGLFRSELSNFTINIKDMMISTSDITNKMAPTTLSDRSVMANKWLPTNILHGKYLYISVIYYV